MDPLKVMVIGKSMIKLYRCIWSSEILLFGLNNILFETETYI